MKMKIMFFLLMTCSIFPNTNLTAQETIPVLTLTAVIDKALNQGEDARILQANLDISRIQHNLNVSKNSFILSGNAGYSEGMIIGDPTQPNYKSSLSSSTLTGAQAGISLSNPMTSVAVSAIPYSPPSILLPYEKIPGATADDPTSSIGVSLNQVLWNGYPGGTGQAAVDKSLLTLQGREIATESGRLSLILKIKQTYYTMLSAQRNISLRKNVLDKQNAVLDLINAIYKMNQASSVDLKTARINSMSAKIDLDSAMHDLNLARIRLSNMIGMQADSAFTVADVPDPEVPAANIDEAIAKGFKLRVEIKQLDLSRKSADIDLALARGLANPTVSVGGNVNWTFDWIGGNAGNANLLVKLSMPILDADSARLQQAAGEDQIKLYGIQTNQTLKTIAADIRDAYETMQLSAGRLDLAKMNAENVAALFDLTKVQVEHGTATNQDLMTASVNAANAQAAYETSKIGYQLAVLQLQSVMGF
jgi:outer membrane protein TolC